MKLFTEHPQSVGESYLQHMGHAFTFSARLFTATLCCLVHGLLPFLFKSTGSAIIGDLHERMVANRMRTPEPNASGRAGSSFRTLKNSAR